MEKIVMLGTGHATVTRCYNACFLLCARGCRLLVDGGGGNGILARLEEAGVEVGDIDAVFVTHAHTDHILGVLWVVRMVGQAALYKGSRKGSTVYGSRKVLDLLDHMGSHMLYEQMWLRIREVVRFEEITDGSRVLAGGSLPLECFDTGAEEPQLGFRASLSGGRTLVCCGDAPLATVPRRAIAGADWLVAESYCLEKDDERFHARAKHHGTVAETASLAQSAGAAGLILYHTEDTSLATRKADYTAEAALHFAGHVCVPDDLEIIDL